MLCEGVSQMTRLNLTEDRKANQALQGAVADAERDLAQGNWVDHSEIEAKLREWAKKATHASPLRA